MKFFFNIILNGLFILKGIGRFLKYGFCLEIVRNLISNYDLILRNPMKILLKRFNWNLIVFLVGYVGIYRVWILFFFFCWNFIWMENKDFKFQFINCLTSRHNTYLREEESNSGHKLASFLSGFTFYFYPNLAVFSHATITIVELFWNKYYEQIKSYMKWIPLDKIKMMGIIFPIVFGYVLHIRAFTPWLAPSMLKKLMHLTTNYKYNSIFDLKWFENNFDILFFFFFVIKF